MPAPPPVPALPDTQRRTSYSITSSTGPFAVNFAIYGDAGDYQNWLEVWLNDVLLNSAQYTLSSPTGSITLIPRPITDAVITLASSSTGTLVIQGARRPRRITTFNESQGVAARDLNQALNDLYADQREGWDFNRTRQFYFPGGETPTTLLPIASVRANGVLAFDPIGNPFVTPITITGTIATTALSLPRSLFSTVTQTSNTVMLSGFYTYADKGAGAIYTSVGAGPSGPMAVQDHAGTWFQLVIVDHFNVCWFGAKGDGVTDETTAIQNALNYASSIGFNTVDFPPGTFMVSNTITLPNGVSMRGNGKRQTFIRATVGFPTATPVVVMGSSSVTFDIKISRMLISASDIANSVGIFGQQLQEGCGIFEVLVSSCRDTGIHLLNCDHIMCWDWEIYCQNNPLNYGLNANNVNGVIERITFVGDATKTATAFNVSAGCVTGFNWHGESCATVLAANAEGSIHHISQGSTGGTYVVHMLAGSQMTVSAVTNDFNNFSFALFDDVTGIGLANYVPLWSRSTRGSSSQVITSSPYTVQIYDTVLIANNAAGMGVVLPNPGVDNMGKQLVFLNRNNNIVDAISPVVVPITGGAAQQHITPPFNGAWSVLESDGTNWNVIEAGQPIQSSAYVDITSATYTVGQFDTALRGNFNAGTITLTLPVSTTVPGRIIYVSTIRNQAVVNSAANIQYLDATSGAGICAATAGKWTIISASKFSDAWQVLANN
jgi:hypothetical protein